MDIKGHFILMAAYNLRMNQQVISASKTLSNHELNENRGAFFNSIIGTFNHIFVADLIWLTRFSINFEHYSFLSDSLIEYKTPSLLDEILFHHIRYFSINRKRLDLLIQKWMSEDVKEDDFHRSIQYIDTEGKKCERNFAELLYHLFNHQTHHRGQLTTILNQSGIDAGVTDFLVEIPDTYDVYS
ncbi:DinB family protein [Endozoicomonas sp. SM1973]|uniref:DinB family protein n=1 Tax=Spartinivicinus marinus TaxID=2994442 RepID=A0A853I7V0_9GAMM|nr:DinB family protein [Spartinivicinus marinus]MCX4027522.1 DinB family protein [Spartinivicinus marinus]NYZ68899.1 DinB family protein [Spartinivicinus marinus]